MLAMTCCLVAGGAAAEGRKHVSKRNLDDPDGFSSVMRPGKRLAVSEGGTTVRAHDSSTVVLTSKRTPQRPVA